LRNIGKSAFPILKSLGPGLVTGASDDDPSGIATYSQAGAQFSFGMLWLAVFQYPLMAVIQEICARIGLVTGGGLNSVIQRKYSKKIVLPLTGLLLIANTVNIGADIGAISQACIPSSSHNWGYLRFYSVYYSNSNSSII
jgi:NRAMP (natural resistance-associated macrophage protein)-like metal ion transporter